MKKKSRIVTKLAGAGFLLAALFAVFGSGRFMAAASGTYEHLELFSEVLGKVQSIYVEPIDGKDLIEGAVRGLMDTLDPHSEYMPPEAFKEMRVQTSGEFGGLGIEITMEDGALKVVSPIEDTPAFKAGIQAGDIISHVNGESITNISLREAVERLRGNVGTKVMITIVREGSPEPFDVEIIRDKIVVKSVKYHMEEGNIGYIKLTQFKSRSTEELMDALAELLAKKPIGLILDLRNNPGGLLDQAVGVSDVFLKEGKVVYTDGRTRDSKMEFFARDDGNEPELPLVLLVNGGSASASEIVAGALKDHKRALVVGSRTFGKGSVQSILRLSNDGGLRITTALYYTPSGLSIQGSGIVPDIKVEAFSGESKLAYREENIEGHFKGAKEKDGKKLTQDEIRKQFMEQKDLVKRFREGELGDAQLDRARELIKSVSMFGPLLRGGASTATTQ